MAEMRFRAAGIQAILAAAPAAADSITFTATRANLSAHADAAALIGTRPVCDFTISCKDGQGNTVAVNVDFPVSSAFITLSYTPGANETSGSLYMVYVCLLYTSSNCFFCAIRLRSAYLSSSSSRVRLREISSTFKAT